MSKPKSSAKPAKKSVTKSAVSPPPVIRKTRRQAVPAKAASATVVRKSSIASNPRRGPASQAPAAKGSDSSQTSTLPKQVAGKTACVSNLIQRPDGASLADLMTATGWQAHSVRGVISGVLRKKLGLSVTLATGADGSRIYRIAE